MKIVIGLFVGLMISPLPRGPVSGIMLRRAVPRSLGRRALYVKDLPKPVLEALAEIQRLSPKVEPDIEKFGTGSGKRSIKP